MNLIDQYLNLLAINEDSPPALRQKRGFQFEKLLYALLASEGLDPRTGFRRSGEQIDGSFFVEGSVFLLEAKWHKDELPASAIYQFKGKVDGKLIGTIGVFISMSGFSTDAVDALTLGKALNVILFDKSDVDTVILKGAKFVNILRSKLRKAAEEGIVYFPSEIQQISKDESISLEFDTSSLPRTTDNIYAKYKKEKMSAGLVIVCEGLNDKAILERFITRILNKTNSEKKVRLLVAMGKYSILKLTQAIHTIVEPVTTLIAVIMNSDGDVKKTKEMIRQNIVVPNLTLIIPDPAIESWLSFNKQEFMDESRAQYSRGVTTINLINNIIDAIDIDNLQKRNESFKEFFNLIAS
jgi:hypothetical protein